MCVCVCVCVSPLSFLSSSDIHINRINDAHFIFGFALSYF